VDKDRILIVEDDTWQAKFLERVLIQEGFAVMVLESGERLFQVMDEDAFTAVVLDLGLPDEDGIVLARKLRARSKIPIIVVTAREGLDDKLASFDVGADDYMTKPVEPKELAARLRAVMRRFNEGEGGKTTTYSVGPYSLDLDRREVSGPDGSTVDLTPAEFSLLAVLCQADGRALSRDELVDAVSTGEGPLSTRAVDILVSRVRKKVGKDVVETVTHTGYRIAKSASPA